MPIKTKIASFRTGRDTQRNPVSLSKKKKKITLVYILSYVSKYILYY